MGFAVLALLGAASWDVGDFFGGAAARRAHVLSCANDRANVNRMFGK